MGNSNERNHNERGSSMGQDRERDQQQQQQGGGERQPGSERENERTQQGGFSDTERQQLAPGDQGGLFNLHRQSRRSLHSSGSPRRRKESSRLHAAAVIGSDPDAQFSGVELPVCGTELHQIPHRSSAGNSHQWLADVPAVEQRAESFWRPLQSLVNAFL